MKLITLPRQIAFECFKHFKLAFFCLIASGLLCGCVPLMIARTGMTGALVATDRRTVGNQVEDRAIALKGELIATDMASETMHINVACYNRIVLITGEVPDEDTRLNVEIAITKIPNIRGLVNELTISEPAGLDSRSSDSLITTQVTASFLNTKNLSSLDIKTVTERGTVYLMGILTEKEGRIAAKVASHVPGVVKVVKIFEHITEEELKQLKAAYTPDTTSPADNTNRFQSSPEYQ